MTLSPSRRSYSRRARRSALVAAVAMMLARMTHAHSSASDFPRVRSTNPQIAAMIKEAAGQSPTFRHLIQTIEATDGIVFVEQGDCGHGVRSCLLHSVVVAAGNRILRIVVNTRQSAWDLMGSIGHELYHATEVLADPSVTTANALYFLYAPGGWKARDTFETDAAIRAGFAVRREVQRSGGHAGRTRSDGLGWHLPASP